MRTIKLVQSFISESNGGGNLIYAIKLLVDANDERLKKYLNDYLWIKFTCLTLNLPTDLKVPDSPDAV